MANPPQKPASPFAALGALREHLAPGPATPAVTAAVTPVDPVAVLLSRRVVVSRERKGHGGKTATRVRFPDGCDPAALDTLAATVRRSLGTAAHVDEDSLVVHGDLVDRVADWLAARGAVKVVRGTA